MKIFITGISSGIGRQIAKHLVGDGHDVWGIARTSEKLQTLVQELGGRLKVSVCDLTDELASEKLVENMRAEKFLPDAFILNAGVYLPDVGNGIDLDKFEKTFKTNVFGVMFWIREFLPDFLARDSGIFLAISSTSAYRPGYDNIGYPASKAALSMAMRGLRLNFSDSKVRFTTVHFGPINTHLWKGKRSFLIPEADRAAAYVASCIHKKSGSYFFPFLSTTLFRLTRFLSDRIFTYFGKFLRSRRN